MENDRLILLSQKVPEIGHFNDVRAKETRLERISSLGSLDC